MGVQILDSDMTGPLPPNSVGLLVGRSSSTLKGLVVHPGVIDQDYTGQIKVMVSSPRGVVAISPGDRIAQLLVLPSLHGLFPAGNGARKEKGFGSSGVDFFAMAFQMHDRPMLTLSIEGKNIKGLLDTGADRSVIAKKDWSPAWPVQQASQTLQGLGYSNTPDISARELHWKDTEGHSGTIQPYVLPLPISLWGRDLLTAMGFSLSNNTYSGQAQKFMLQQGFHPSFGLGVNLQGRRSPIPTKTHQAREGLGFS